MKKPKKCARLLLLVPLLVLLLPALSACTAKLSKPKNVYRIEPLTPTYDTTEMTILNCCAAKDTVFLLMKGSGGYEILATDGKAEKTIVPVLAFRSTVNALSVRLPLTAREICGLPYKEATAAMTARSILSSTCTATAAES